MIDSLILSDYMARFVGFGIPHAKLWFVGLEQGGGESLDELQRRLDVWTDLGGEPFADLREYCVRLGETRWHGDRPRIQSTLGQMVRIVLASTSRACGADAVRDYQSLHLGRIPGETVVTELMPLPSRSVSDWIYSDIQGVPALATREEYLAYYRPLRVELLRGAIKASEPVAVVFLGLSEKNAWEAIADAPLATGPAGALWAHKDNTRFVAVKHPTAFGSKNSYFEEIGRAIAA